ncbi:MAG: M23 family metallopeptidase, partial [Egibacteraceae bacterium]
GGGGGGGGPPATRASRSAAAPPPASAPPPPPQQATASGWHRPSDGRFSSGYGMRRHPIYGTGRMHTGVDFGSPSGAPIYAATGGTVISAGWRGGYGLAVVVDHGNGVATLYAHSSQVLVSPGQRVGRGQVIARIGSTGQSTGPHLHFEVRVHGQHRDPMPYLR